MTPDQLEFVEALAKAIEAERCKRKHDPWVYLAGTVVGLALPAGLAHWAFGWDFWHAYAGVWAAALTIGTAVGHP